MQSQVDKELDAKGLKCPMPVMKLRTAIGDMEAGQVIKVETTDRGSVPDFSAWAKKTGNTILEQEEDSGKFVFLIRKGA